MGSQINEKSKFQLEMNILNKVLAEKMKIYDECLAQENLLSIEINELESKMKSTPTVDSFDIDYEDYVPRLYFNGELLKSYAKVINENKNCTEQMISDHKNETSKLLMGLEKYKKRYNGPASDKELKRLEGLKNELNEKFEDYKLKNSLQVDKNKEYEEKLKLVSNLNLTLEISEQNRQKKLEDLNSKQKKLKSLRAYSSSVENQNKKVPQKNKRSRIFEAIRKLN